MEVAVQVKVTDASEIVREAIRLRKQTPPAARLAAGGKLVWESVDSCTSDNVPPLWCHGEALVVALAIAGN